MEELNNKSEESNVKINKEKVTYQQILDKIKSVYDNFEIPSQDMVNIFNEKYKEAGIVQLLNEKGEVLVDKNNNRIEPVEFEKIDDRSKEVHMRGILYRLSQNPVNLTSKILNEKEILSFLKEKEINFEEMIKNYKNNS